MSKKELSSSEAVIMKVIWDANGELPVPELISRLKDDYGREYARSTIATFLLRLSDKRFIDTRREKRVSYVFSLITEEEYREAIAVKDTDFWFEGSAAKFLSSLTKNRKLSAEEKQKIRKILNELDD